MELDDEDDEHQPPLLPPDDRLWRHPSEVASVGLPGGRHVLPRRSRRGDGAWWRWSGPFLAGATGAVLVIGLVTAVGGFRTREVPIEVTRRVAGPPYEAQAPSDVVADGASEIIDKAHSTMVQVRAERSDGTRNGSGFIMRDDGYVLTSARVIHRAERVWVTLSDRSRHLASIIGADLETAVGVLKLDRSPVTGAVFGASTTVKVGQTVLALGMPTWAGVGSVAAVGREVHSKDTPLLVDMIQFSDPCDPLASGGPLLDRRGAVIGLLDVHGTTGYATPIDIALKVADDLIRTGEVSFPWLGVEGEDVDAELASRLGIGGGALVVEVEDESPAYAAGIHPGDVIVQVESARIGSMAALKLELRNRRVGEAVTVKLLRQGEGELSINATLTVRPF